MTGLTECERLAQRLIEPHLPEQGWSFEFDDDRTRGGQCRSFDRMISMSRRLVPMWSTEQIEQVLLHEIAHALTHEEGHYAGGARSHGREWLRIARRIGYVGTIRHNNPTVDDPEPTPIRWPGADIRGRWTRVTKEGLRRVVIDHVHRQVLVPPGSDFRMGGEDSVT